MSHYAQASTNNTAATVEVKQITRPCTSAALEQLGVSKLELRETEVVDKHSGNTIASDIMLYVVAGKNIDKQQVLNEVKQETGIDELYNSTRNGEYVIRHECPDYVLRLAFTSKVGY